MYRNTYCQSEGYETRIDYYDTAIKHDPDVQEAWGRISETLDVIRQSLIRIQAPPSIIDQLYELDDYIIELETADIEAIARTDEVAIAFMLGKIHASVR